MFNYLKCAFESKNWWAPFSLCKDNVCSEYKSVISIFDVNGTFHPKIKNAYIHLICNAIIILLYIVLVGDTELKKYVLQGYILYSFIHSFIL